MAVESCAQLAGESIPADFEVAEEYSQTIAAVRQRYTNYDALLDALPASRATGLLSTPNKVGAECGN